MLIIVHVFMYVCTHIHKHLIIHNTMLCIYTAEELD